MPNDTTTPTPAQLQAHYLCEVLAGHWPPRPYAPEPADLDELNAAVDRGEA